MPLLEKLIQAVIVERMEELRQMYSQPNNIGRREHLAGQMFELQYLAAQFFGTQFAESL
jgi:hypothetical protein